MQVSTTNASLADTNASHIFPVEGRSTRALVIDDEVVTRSLVHACLAKSGWTVTEAESGEEALDKYAELQPDVIVLDLLMPGQDGFEICTEFRKRGATNTPILIMTGLEDNDAVHRAYDAGATDFVSKPIDYTVLPYRLRWILDASRSMSKVQESERRLRKAQQVARLGSWELQQDGAALVASEEVLRIFGVSSAEFTGNYTNLLRHVHPHDRLRVNKFFLSALDGVPLSLEHRIVDATNNVRHVRQEVEIVASEGAGSSTVFGTVQDVTDFRRAQQQLFQMHYFDRLTGLPNQSYVERQTKQTPRPEGEPVSLVVMAVKILNLKRVNGSFGRSVGDKTLITMAERLRAIVQTDSGAAAASGSPAAGKCLDLVARLGDSEFGIVRYSTAERSELESFAKKVNERLSELVDIDGRRFTPETRIGVAITQADPTDPTYDVQGIIDDACHARDLTGDDESISFHSADLDQRVANSFKLESELGCAVEREEFVVHYQPKIALATGKVVGVEALARWRHPERGLVPPSEFLPLAERTGVILDLGEWVLRQALLDVEIHAKSLKSLRLAFNLSPRQFSDLDLLPRLRRLLDDVSVPPSVVELEVTEGALMDDAAIGEQVVAELKAVGVKIALDDFGTSFSSMTYLKNYPLDIVKIDHRFVHELVESDYSRAMVASLVALSQMLGKTVVAEGVETEREFDVVRELKCDQAQGYHFCKPLPIEELVSWVEEQNTNEEA